MVGAVGVLERAADRGLIADLATVHDRIRSLPFRVAEVILQDSLTRHIANKVRTNTVGLNEP